MHGCYGAGRLVFGIAKQMHTAQPCAKHLNSLTGHTLALSKHLAEETKVIDKMWCVHQAVQLKITCFPLSALFCFLLHPSGYHVPPPASSAQSMLKS